MTAPRRVPRLLPLPQGKSLQSFPLAPVDGFVLSRIDGSTAETDIVSITGLDAEMVRASLEKLVGLGLVSFGNTQPPGLGATSAPPVAPASSPKISADTIPPRPVSDTPSSMRLDLRSEAAPAPRGLYDPAELDEDVDLERDHRRKVLDLYHRLEELDHYALLGIPRDSDKKAIKRAYYEAAGLFHPDRYFRKRLGSFKVKMEQVFSRVTLAHDTLTNKEAREEYDRYLGDQQAAAAIEADLMAPITPPEALEGAPSPSAPPKVTTTEPPRTPHPMSSSPPKVSEQARREALARRLMGARASVPPRAASVPSMPAVGADPDALRRHYEARVEAMRATMVKEHVDNANAAMEKSDWGAALSAFKLAMAAAPNDAALRAKLAEAQHKATEQLAENYRRQAQYEEKGERWPEAARSWTRVAKTLTHDIQAHDRAAFCLLKADGNLHEAAGMAQRAITLDPTKPAYRITLAEVYMAAGLGLNAKRELEAALQIAPGDATIQTLLKRIKA